MKTEKEFIDSIYAKKRSHDKMVRRYTRVGVSLMIAIVFIPAAIFLASGGFLAGGTATESLGNDGATLSGIGSGGVVAEGDEGNRGNTVSVEDDGKNYYSGTSEVAYSTLAAAAETTPETATSPTYATEATAGSDLGIHVESVPTEEAAMQSTAFEEEALYAEYRTELRRIYKEGVGYADAVIAAVEKGAVSDRDMRETAYELIFTLEKIVESSYLETLAKDDLIEITVMANAVVDKLYALYNALP